MLFETIKRDSEGLKPSYGKWLALFLLTFLFNGMTIFNRWWLTLFDLAIKCSLYFLPESIVLDGRYRTQRSSSISVPCILKDTSKMQEIYLSIQCFGYIKSPSGLFWLNSALKKLTSSGKLSKILWIVSSLEILLESLPCPRYYKALEPIAPSFLKRQWRKLS